MSPGLFTAEVLANGYTSNTGSVGVYLPFVNENTALRFTGTPNTVLIISVRTTNIPSS